MFDGVYPERRRCRAVDDPIVPPPPTMMILVFSREWIMLDDCFGACLVGVIVLDKMDRYPSTMVVTSIEGQKSNCDNVVR